MIEGFPSVICGIISFYYLSDLPKDAHWLSKEEKEWITSVLALENAAKGIAHKNAN